MPDAPDLATIQSTVQDILDSEAAREIALERELESLEEAGLRSFDRTWAIIAEERDLLATLDDLLAAERAHIDDLEDVSGYLEVDQAVRNRDEALEKLTSHNRYLQEFHDDLTMALDAVSTNLDTLESNVDPAFPADPDPHLAAARDALENHNEAVEGLGTNLRILTQYMS